MAIDQIAQLGLSSLKVIYYLEQLFRFNKKNSNSVELEASKLTNTKENFSYFKDSNIVKIIQCKI
ncbi:hypothetical protein BHG07_15510 [Brenneria salicis ATCC 15712 = DSM 30166]|nr:hypothetical protein BHG07_15510 [Brenneria salicis ATCC 15712 = DSM 30166]